MAVNYLSKHAFGSEANVDSAIARGLIDAYDILFLDEKKIGWIDVNGNKVIIDKQVKEVFALPSAGKSETLYICNGAVYYWTGTKFAMITGSESGTSEAVVDAKIQIAKADIKTYVDTQIANATDITDEDGDITQLNVKTTTANKLDSIAIRDGQFIFVRDQSQLVFDYDGTRTLYGNVVELVSDYKRLTLPNPIEGTIYFVVNTGLLWLYRKAGWQQLTKKREDYIFIGTELPVVGSSSMLYVNKLTREICIWDDTLGGYATIANLGSNTSGGGSSGGNDTVILEQILIAKGEAISIAQEDATIKAATAEQNAIAHAETRFAPVETTVLQHSTDITALQTKDEDTEKVLIELWAELDILEERIDAVDGTTGVPGIAIELITDEEIDALFA